MKPGVPLALLVVIASITFVVGIIVVVVSEERRDINLRKVGVYLSITALTIIVLRMAIGELVFAFTQPHGRTFVHSVARCWCKD